jgi:hypothetical protein
MRTVPDADVTMFAKADRAGIDPVTIFATFPRAFD